MEQNNKQSKNMPRHVNGVNKTAKQIPVAKRPPQAAALNATGSLSKQNTAQKPHTKQNQQDLSKKRAEQRPVTDPKQAQSRSAVQLTKEQKINIIREERKRRELARKAKREYIISVTIIFAVSFMILSALFAGVFFFMLTSHDKPDNSDYILELSDYDNSIEVISGCVVKESGLRYVNFSKIAEFYGFAMVGSIDDMKYVIKKSGNETVAFAPDSDKAFVNDVAVRTKGPAFYDNGDLFVCQSFVEEYILGLDIETDSDNRTLKIDRVLLNTVDSDGKIADGKEPEYENLSFMLKAPAVSVSINENDSAVTVPEFEFYSDISAYEEYMNPGSTTEFLTLVNQTRKLSSDYIPTGLSLLKYGDGMYLKEYAAKSFEAMMKEASACGINGLTVSKAYVSYEQSLSLYNDVIDEYINLLGNDQANRYAAATVNVPGTDEHQTGLAVDFSLNNGGEFSKSNAFAWLCDNSYKFGYILRYPLNKNDVTGRGYTPQQFRYVGRYHAVRMNALNLTLDEYCEYLGL